MHARTLARPHACTLARVHARTHACTHAHMSACIVRRHETSWAREQMESERAEMQRQLRAARSEADAIQAEVKRVFHILSINISAGDRLPIWRVSKVTSCQNLSDATLRSDLALNVCRRHAPKDRYKRIVVKLVLRPGRVHESWTSAISLIARPRPPNCASTALIGRPRPPDCAPTRERARRRCCLNTHHRYPPPARPCRARPHRVRQ